MHELTGKHFHTSEQDKEMSEARRERDRKDTEKILAFFTDYDPFQESNELTNIANGMTGPPSTHPHLLYEVGINIVQKMEWSNVFIQEERSGWVIWVKRLKSVLQMYQSIHSSFFRGSS